MQTLFNWLSNPSFRSLALSLLASLWQAGLIFLVVYGLIRLNKNAPARIKYNIAGIGQLILACWFVQTFFHHLSLQNTVSGSLTGSEAAMLFYPGRLPVFSAMYPGDTVSAGFQWSRCIPVTLCLYILGVLIMMIRIIYAYGQTRMLKTKGLLTVPAIYIKHMEQICGQLNIYSKVRLYFSNRIQVPLMMGLIKPVILLPIAIATHLTTAQIEAIITHELAHIRRQDYLINLIQSIAEAIFFFNPFVWLLSGIMREEREKACDDLVVREVPAYTYATALLALEKMNGTKQLTLAANGHNSFKLLNRIKLFTMKQNPILTLRQKAVSLLLIVAGIGCLAWLSPEKARQQQKSTLPDASSATAQANVQQHAQNNTGRAGTSIPDTATPSSRGFSYNDSLSPARQRQIDEIAKSARQMAEKITHDSAWQKSVQSIGLNAERLAAQLEADPTWKKSAEQMAEKAKTMAEKMTGDPQLKKQLQELQNQAENISDKYKPTPETQKQLEDLRNRSLAIALKFTNDPAWQKQIKEIGLKAAALAHKMKDDPEFRKKIQEMAEKSRDLAMKVVNDPHFKAQLDKLQTDLQHISWPDAENKE